MFSFLLPSLNRSNMNKDDGPKSRKSKLVSLFSNIYIFFFYYHLLLNILLFQPLLINIPENIPDNVELYYFPNQMGAYLYNRSDRKRKVLFYISCFSGNISCRFNIISRLKDYLPPENTEEYYIVAIDLPGFGLSNMLKPELTTVADTLLYCINFYIESEEINEYSLFTEYESSVPISSILKHLQRKPRNIIHFNGIDSFYNNLLSKYSVYSSLLFVPLLRYKSLSNNYQENNDSTRILLIQNEEKIYQNTEDIFFDLVDHCKVKSLQVVGEGITSMIASCNHETIKDFIHENF